MDKFQRGVRRDIFFTISNFLPEISPYLLIGVLNYQTKFLEMKFNLIFQLFLVQIFLEKFILLWLNVVWNSTSNKIFTFSQWVVKLIFKLSHTLWGFMVDNWFQYKITSSISIPTDVFQAIPLQGYQNYFRWQRINDIDFRLKNIHDSG